MNDIQINPLCSTNDDTSDACMSFTFDTDLIPHGTYSVNYFVMAQGGGYTNTTAAINVVCSLEMVQKNKKFTIPFRSSTDLVEVIKA